MKLLKTTLRLIALGATIAVGLQLGACSKPPAEQEPIRAVKVITVGVQPMQSGLEYSADVRARVDARLSFRVPGKLVSRQVELGQQVKAGQVLAQLDPTDLKLAADAARAQVVAAQTNRDLAATDFKRFQALKEQSFISGAELERRQSVLSAAQAQLDQAKAQLSSQGNQVGYANLYADVSGVVTAVLADPGQVLSAGTPVVQVAQDGARDVVFSVPEDKVSALKVGAAVTVHAWSGNAAVQALVRDVAASADPVTRTFTVKVALPASTDWPLGSTVSVAPVALQHTGVQVIKLPTSALRQDGQGSAVWVLDSANMTVKLQKIQIATADGNDVVITAGLAPGQQVVVAGVHVLAAGQKVTVYKGKQPVALASPSQTAPGNIANSALTPASGPVAPIVSK